MHPPLTNIELKSIEQHQSLAMQFALEQPWEGLCVVLFHAQTKFSAPSQAPEFGRG
jgi:hypothetical protein